MQKYHTISTRILAIMGVLFFFQLLLIYFSIDQSKALIWNLNQASNVELPATKALSNADMMHDGIRAVVLDALYSYQLKKYDTLSEIYNEAKEKSKLFIEQVEILEKLPLKVSTLENFLWIKLLNNIMNKQTWKTELKKLKSCYQFEQITKL